MKKLISFIWHIYVDWIWGNIWVALVSVVASFVAYWFSSQAVLSPESVEGYRKTFDVIMYSIEYISLVATIISGITVLGKIIVLIFKSFADYFSGK